MAFRLPDLQQAPRAVYEELILENRRRSRSVPEVGAFAASIALGSRFQAEVVPGDQETQSLWFSYEATLNEVEADGRSRARRGEELSYHNRAHVADCLLALACLLKLDNCLDEKLKLLGLLVMAGHDLGHQGFTNEQLGSPGEQERQTLARLAEGAWAGLPSPYLELASRLVLGTDPAVVMHNHQQMLETKEFDASRLLQVYVNEADIAGSLHPGLAEVLTMQLLAERNQAVTKSAAAGLYRDFRRKAMVSSAAGRLLFGHV
ncbi:MAG: hypothetical protein RLY67_189 [Pseudomonadota bacterium]|jgi:hypothetical protein